ncbi:MAG: hypothetical protein KDB82_18560 [Planctomycetes bacterium]|nr:hypothetical protein [Planctomycetota bacterium]
MKYLIPILILLLAGCSSLQYALETAERSRDAMEKAGAELRDALEVTDKAREKYIEALKEGDTDKVEATLKALQAAEEERRARELNFDETQKAFRQASAELETAKQQDNYLEGVLGLILGGIIGGGSGFLTGRKKKPE